MRFLSKIGVYKIQTQGVTIDVKLVENEAVVAEGLSELKSHIGTTTAVGLVLEGQILQLCVGTRCLLVRLSYTDVPKCLGDFLADKETCFVGFGMNSTRSDLNASLSLSIYYGIDCKNAVDVTELAARILKKPKLCGCELATIAAEVGVSLEESPRLEDFNWGASVFSDEEVKYAIQDAYACHLIGTKLLAML